LISEQASGLRSIVPGPKGSLCEGEGLPRETPGRGGIGKPEARAHQPLITDLAV
jgi:hypothetical protein